MDRNLILAKMLLRAFRTFFILLLGLSFMIQICYGSTQNGAPSGRSSQRGRKSDITLPGKVLVIPAKKAKLTEKALKGISSASEKALNIASALVQSASRINRDIKAYFSSDFEVLLLRMTSPSDEMIPAVDTERFVATIQSFIHNDDVISESNTYRVTLRKIWAKIAEPDSRTSLKAVYMLHTLLKSSKPADGAIFRKLVMKMAKEYSTRSKTKYFNVKQLEKSRSGSADTHDVHKQQLQKFWSAYAEFVVMRGNSFLCNFEELKDINFSSKAKGICALLNKASTLIDAALAAGNAGLLDESEIVAFCLELAAEDLVELWHLYGTKLLWLLREHEVGDVFEGWNDKTAIATLNKLKSSFVTRYDAVQKMLSEVKELVELYKETALPAQLPISKDSLEGYL